jgi:ribulose 1,5-bisphosphate carboxylase large subunit-like protein
MGESGQAVSFVMTAEEIAAEDTVKERIAARRGSQDDKQKQRRKVFEMGESSQMISFLLTAFDEIAAEDAKIVRLKARHDCEASKEVNEVIAFELAESGEHIEFPVKEVEISSEGVAQTAVEIVAGPEKNPNC